jgi:hypothetical protein
MPHTQHTLSVAESVINNVTIIYKCAIKMQTLAFLLILASATIHASWNTLARHVKGNTPALVFAHFIGSLMVFPFIFLYPNAFRTLSCPWVVPLMTLSLFSHAMYVMLLSSAYVYGDVGLVYPLARGTGMLHNIVLVR